MVSVDDGIRAKARCNGVTTGFQSRVAVLCNGFGGSLPKKTGFGRTGDFVLGAQVEVNTRGVQEVECYFGQSIAPGFFAWLVPTASDKALMGLLTRRNPRVYLKKLLSKLTDQGRVTTTNAPINYGGIPLMPLKKTYGERKIIVGDAAADTVNEALQADSFSARKLSQYETRWKKLLGQELQVGYVARRIYENLNDNQIEGIFELIQSHGIHEELLQAPDFSFDWHSRHVIKALRHRILGKTIQSVTKLKLPNLD
jgi:flavin-dependent dehydrogenase